MTYATAEDLVTRFGEVTLAQLTDRGELPDGKPDEAVLTAVLTDATETIDGYAAARYRTPLSPVPAPVRRWCADMAVYYLYVATGNVPDDVRKAFEDAMTGLKDMSKGLITFQCEGVVAESAPSSGDILVSVPPRMFTPGSLKGF